MHRTPGLGLAVFLLASGVAVGVVAQAEPDRDRAREAYAQARLLDAEGRTAEALEYAWQAYRLYPSGASRYAVGLLYERSGAADEAARQYRMALGEAEAPSESVRTQIVDALERLGAPPDPMVPEPAPRASPHAVVERDSAQGHDEGSPSPLEGSATATVSEDQATHDEPELETGPRRRRLGLGLRGVMDGRRPSPAAAVMVEGVYELVPGIAAGLALLAPAWSVLLRGEWTPLTGMFSPYVALFVGWSSERGDDTQGGGVFLGPAVGVGLSPSRHLPLSFVAEVGLSIDLARTDAGFAFTVPLSLGLRVHL